ncbi:MAG TPA: hypothetical protein PKV27_10800 [Ilumatobacteraceae bacterium]|nr:hypothetical protein [Ilumatobacteraceae bacterium]
MSALLQVSDLVKTFGQGDTATRVLRGLSLTLERAEMAATRPRQMSVAAGHWIAPR